MNKAIEIAQEKDFDYALFIQDDMQFVRKSENEDMGNFDRFFTHNEDSVQLVVYFFPLRRYAERGQEMTLDPSGVAWMRRPECEGGTSYFSDVGVFHVGRLHHRLGHFERGENVDSARYAEAGLYRGCIARQ